MSRVSKSLFVVVASFLFSSALIAVSANHARSQGEVVGVQSDEWQPLTPRAVAPQPDKRTPPPDVAGCWSGDLDDNVLGSGSGFAFIVQKGGKILKGTMIGVSFPAGPSAQHGIKGSINNKGALKLHLTQFSCTVDIHGKVVSDEVVGTFYLNKRCGLGRRLKGTFDFTFDAGGTSCQ